MKTLPIPPLTPQLIEALAQRFPDQCPSLTDPERVVWSKVGSAQVVAFLRAELRKQENDRITSIVHEE